MIANYSEGQHSIVEAFKNMRTSLTVNKDLKTILVTSSEMGEGKTTTVSNLAKCFADLPNLKILIIDCDLRRPSIHKQFELGETRGLTDILINKEDIYRCIKKEDNLHILQSGQIPKNPAELLDSEDMRGLIELMESRYDYIFIDSPPVSRANDACIVAKYTDGTLIVSASNEVDRDLVRLTKSRLEKVNANIIGVILNKFKLSEQMHYHYYFYEHDINTKKGFKFLKRKKR